MKNTVKILGCQLKKNKKKGAHPERTDALFF